MNYASNQLELNVVNKDLLTAPSRTGIRLNLKKDLAAALIVLSLDFMNFRFLDLDVFIDCLDTVIYFIHRTSLKTIGLVSETFLCRRYCYYYFAVFYCFYYHA